MYRVTTYLLKLVSYLPFSVLYVLSDFLFFLLYHVLGYRKSVVLTNLRNSFPEKDETELRKICKAYYGNLCDVMVESIKAISLSKEELMKRNDCSSHRLIDGINAGGRSVFYFAGHLCNWEWSPSVVALSSKERVWGVYKKVTHQAYDEMMNTYRSKFGCEMIPMEKIARRILADNGIKNVCFVADQTPSNTEANMWVRFLHQDTLAFSASAKLAKKLNIPIIYASIHREKRGYYRYHFETLFENPAHQDEQVMMQTFFDRLEKDIHQSPESWLWSHKRWKHKRMQIKE